MLIGGFDVETIPSQDIPKELRPQFDPSTVKLGNTKDPFKVEAKIVAGKKDFEAGINKKMATDSMLCQVCTFVGMVYDTDTNKIIADKTSAVHWPLNRIVDEYEVVYEAWNFIKHCHSNSIPLASYNGKSFDLPVLYTKAILLDIPVDRVVYNLYIDKWKVTKHHYDMMQVLVGNHPEKGKNLDFYLRRFGLGAKTSDMDGSKVYEKWLNEDHQEILDYCKDDVLSTCKLFARLAPWIEIRE